MLPSVPSGVLRVAVSEIWPAGRVAVSVASVVIVEGQLLTFTFSGGTKSLSAAVNESDERLLRYAEPNEPHWPSPKSASNVTWASPKVRGLSEPRALSAILLVLMEPAASIGFCSVSTVAGPHFVPVH